jgi:hypothetical protein
MLLVSIMQLIFAVNWVDILLPYHLKTVYSFNNINNSSYVYHYVADTNLQ